jgi:pyruvate dehydrogenase E2 component (dihydrolipoamide acetyltransferase)
MAKIIGLPKLSPTMEEGTLVRWVKNEGDPIEVDDLVAEVETDKATMEFRSFDKGFLLKQLAPEGSTLQPDQPVAIFGNKGEDISGLVAKAGGAGGSGGAGAGEAAAPAKPEAAKPAAAPEAKASAPQAAPQPEPEPEQEPAHSGSGRVIASPVVRKIAREKDLDLTRVRGSGPNGRVVKRDVESADARQGLPGQALRGPSVAPPPVRSAPAAGQKAGVPGGATAAGKAPVPTQHFPAAGEGDRVEKLSQMRKTIARRLTESKQQVPHFYLTIDVDAEPLSAARASINAELEASGEKISLNDLLIKACAVALRRVPAVNASFLGDSIAYHDRVDISVAVAVPDGLVTPVVRNADQLGVLSIARLVKDLAGRAKDKKLKPEEMQNGTFSISNLGMFGIDEFSAVINPPEGAILAVGAVRDEPVVKKGAVVPGKKLAMTLSCDHRVVDGAVGAEFLKVLRSIVESPLRMII